MLRLFAVLLILSSGAASASPVSPGNYAEELTSGTVIAHGGGCRKSSPPGKCCHMETRTGKVHCH